MQRILASTGIAILFFCITSLHDALGQDAISEVAHAPLFETDEALALTLKTDLAVLFKDRGDDPEEQPASISYLSEDGSIVTQDLKVRLRGIFRKMLVNCSFPPIRFNFSKEAAEGTLFEGQDKLKLVTHCQDREPYYEQYVLLEYLIYRMYNQLTDLSFRVRLVHMTYEDTSGKRRPLTRYGFLIEDEDAMALRNGGNIVDQEGYHQESTDYNLITVHALFEYMVGNTDWSVPALHNIRLVETKENLLPYAVPYDFDFAGLINTPYARPDPLLPIKTVRERYYRGYCRTEEELAPHISLFHNKKAAIYALFEDLEPLDRKFRESALVYLDEFYAIIDSARRVRRAFIRSCQRLN